MTDTRVLPVRRRFLAYVNGGRVDQNLILSDEAESEAREIWQACLHDDPDHMPFEVVDALAWLHWARYYAMPEGEDRDDLQASAVLFSHIYGVDPNRVPDELVALLAETGGSGLRVEGNGGIPAYASQSYVEMMYPSAVNVRIGQGPDWTFHRALALLNQPADPKVVDEAIGLLRELVVSEPAGGIDSSPVSYHLGQALWSRFRRTGELTDLDEAISLHRTALAEVKTGSSAWTTVSAALGVVLGGRFVHVGDMISLDESIAVLQAAAEYAAKDDANRSGILMNLSLALRHRYERSAIVADIAAAVEIGQAALAATPVNDTTYLRKRAQLVETMKIQFAVVAATADLDTATDDATAARSPVLPPQNAVEQRLQHISMASVDKPDINGLREGQPVVLINDVQGQLAHYPEGTPGTVLIRDTSPAHVDVCRVLDLHDVLLDGAEEVITTTGADLRKVPGARLNVLYSDDGRDVQLYESNVPTD